MILGIPGIRRQFQRFGSYPGIPTHGLLAILGLAFYSGKKVKFRNKEIDPY
jgi:hypothetical protein